MSKVFTFSNLGHYGALGNQLWQIAGVLGQADKDNAWVMLPQWDYEEYFNIPDYYFKPKPAELVDLWPNYFQELHYFEQIEVVIKDLFSPSEMTRNLIARRSPICGRKFSEAKRIVGVHVRRANNLNLPDHHPVPTLDYFEQALDIVPHDQILVCSDDLEWCKQQSIFKDAAFGLDTPKGLDKSRLTDAHPYTNEEAVLDLFLLSMCDSHIISNSSFSWWAAYLGEGEHIIRPERWYGPALEHIDINAMMPEEWIAI